MHASRPGINWFTADRALLHDFGNCFRVELHWENGDYCYILEETKEDAIASLKRYGFKTHPSIKVQS